MKKVFATVALLGLCFQFLSAQGVYIGPRIGATFANAKVDGENEPNFDNRTSVLFGGALELGLGDNFAIQPEVSYISRGFDGGDDGIFGAAPTLKLNYLDLGGLVKLKTGSSEQLSAYVGIGPSYSYLLNGEIGDVEINFDDGDTFKRGDWTANFAAGVQLPLGESYLFVDIRYLLGLTDVNENDDIEVRNRSYAISAGLMLPL
ncbi:MAG: porin family protein [Phaeodactylibacter sp.]|uniref:porin family protein n=1 Tax=Phaeodactylibacter sp. TaxID=1940289 RepID=UPI0032EDE460